jgi:ubiquinone/menaquinone biosynthesis C-methylase UbiE
MDKTRLAVDTYDKIAPLYDAQYPIDELDTEHIDKFLSLIPQGGKILDIGSGTGNFTKYMADKSYAVEGIDLSEGMLTQARKNVPNGDFKIMDMRDLDFPENSFDGLLSAYSLIHIHSEEILKTLQGFYKVLKSGGFMMLMVQRGESDKVIDEPLMAGRQMFVNFFTKDRISQLLRNANFTIIYQREVSDYSYTKAPSNDYIFTIAKK